MEGESGRLHLSSDLHILKLEAVGCICSAEDATGSRFRAPKCIGDTSGAGVAFSFREGCVGLDIRGQKGKLGKENLGEDQADPSLLCCKIFLHLPISAVLTRQFQLTPDDYSNTPSSRETCAGSPLLIYSSWPSEV